jgi:hypothetical protein
MRIRGSISKGLLITLVFALSPLSAYGTNHAGPKTPSCGNYKVSTNEIIVGVKFPKGTYQINAFGISCAKVMGSKGLFAKFLKLKDKDPLPKPWYYLADAVGAPKFSSGPGVGFRVQLIAARPTPTPSPTPEKTPTIDNSFVPWSTEFAIENVSERAFKSFLDWSKEQALSPRKHQVIVQDTLKDFKIVEDLQKIDKFTSGLFSQYFKTKSVTVIGSDEQWVISQIFASGGNLRNSQGRCNERYDFLNICMNRDSHFGMVVLDDCLLSKSPPCGISLLPHEYFHLVQLNLADNVEGQHWNYGFEEAKNSFPHWLVEGSANFIASAIASIYLDGKYSDFRKQSLSNRSRGPHMANALVDYEVITPNQGWDEIRASSYNIGHIATEYIVASIGFQKFLEIWKDYAVTKNFYLSFERITGISTTTFYSKFESARQSLRIPSVTWKRDENLQNKIINP